LLLQSYESWWMTFFPSLPIIVLAIWLEIQKRREEAREKQIDGSTEE